MMMKWGRGCGDKRGGGGGPPPPQSTRELTEKGAASPKGVVVISQSSPRIKCHVGLSIQQIHREGRVLHYC